MLHDFCKEPTNKNKQLILCLSVCFFKPIRVKTAELIGPTFFMGPHMIPRKVPG